MFDAFYRIEYWNLEFMPSQGFGIGFENFKIIMQF